MTKRVLKQGFPVEWFSWVSDVYRCELDGANPHVSILASIVNLVFLYCFPVPVDKLLDSISSQVAGLLKEEREKHGLSLNVLSQKSGLSRQTISYVEQEVQNPTLDTLLRITSALEVDLEKIIAQARLRAKDK